VGLQDGEIVILSATYGPEPFAALLGEALTSAHVVAGWREIRADCAAAQLLVRYGTNDLALKNRTTSSRRARLASRSSRGKKPVASS
jgi:hypothetical protein